MSNDTEIRKIEKIVDAYYKTSSFIQLYKNNMEKALLDILRTFEHTQLINSCMAATAMESGEDTVNAELTGHQLQDALTMSINWIFDDCVASGRLDDLSFDDANYYSSFEFLTAYALPYSKITDAYISYSRKAMSGTVDRKTVVFDSTPEQLMAFVQDTGENFKKDLNGFNEEVRELLCSPRFLEESNKMLSSVQIIDGMLQYDIPDTMKNVYRQAALAHWDITSEVPQNWGFDQFSLEEFKKCWVELYVICSSRMFVITKNILDADFAQTHCVIDCSYSWLRNALITNTEVPVDRIEAILSFLSFDKSLNNTDIMYQPLIRLGERVLIAPSLIIASNPERNTLAVIQKKKDSKYSIEVNGLEKVMRNELEASLPQDVLRKSDCNIGKENPDIDLCVYDPKSNSVLMAEMKWLIATDSSKEVYSRQMDIEHGCHQVELEMNYAMKDRIGFVKKIFGIDILDEPELFYCVVAKHNISSTNRNVPVISLNRMEELLQRYSYDTVLHIIRLFDYYRPLPDNVQVAKEHVNYAGYSFYISALAFG